MRIVKKQIGNSLAQAFVGKKLCAGLDQSGEGSGFLCAEPFIQYGGGQKDKSPTGRSITGLQFLDLYACVDKKRRCQLNAFLVKSEEIKSKNPERESVQDFWRF